jgi:hypothetical protein
MRFSPDGLRGPARARSPRAEVALDRGCAWLAPCLEFARAWRSTSRTVLTPCFVGRPRCLAIERSVSVFPRGPAHLVGIDAPGRRARSLGSPHPRRCLRSSELLARPVLVALLFVLFQFCDAKDCEKQLELIAYRHTSTDL